MYLPYNWSGNSFQKGVMHLSDAWTDSCYWLIFLMRTKMEYSRTNLSQQKYNRRKLYSRFHNFWVAAAKNGMTLKRNTVISWCLWKSELNSFSIFKPIQSPVTQKCSPDLVGRHDCIHEEHDYIHAFKCTQDYSHPFFCVIIWLNVFQSLTLFLKIQSCPPQQVINFV